MLFQRLLSPLVLILIDVNIKLLPFQRKLTFSEINIPGVVLNVKIIVLAHFLPLHHATCLDRVSLWSNRCESLPYLIIRADMFSECWKGNISLHMDPIRRLLMTVLLKQGLWEADSHDAHSWLSGSWQQPPCLRGSTEGSSDWVPARHSNSHQVPRSQLLGTEE